MTSTARDHINEAEIIQREEDARRFPPGHPVHAAVQRVLSNHFSFWALCESSFCRRGRTCQGVRPGCFDACTPLVSAEVGEAGMCIFRAKSDGASFDEIVERWPEELALWWSWTERIQDRVGGKRARGRARVR